MEAPGVLSGRDEQPESGGTSPGFSRARRSEKAVFMLCNSCNSCNWPEFGIVLHLLHESHATENAGSGINAEVAASRARRTVGSIMSKSSRLRDGSAHCD